MIFLAAVSIHLFFYVSAYFTHTLDIFFDHVTMGQDFFQVPNGAYAFLRGGLLNGKMPDGLPRFADCCGVNDNVYHPFFTLLIGTPLQLFPPWVAFGIWGFMHLVITIVLVIFLWKKFHDHKYLFLALSIYLLNSYHYYEIQHAQYHFLLSFFTILFLFETMKCGDTKKAALYFVAGLFVKPIGLLWIVPLLLHNYFRIVFIGMGIYILYSLPFLGLSYGRYYFENLYNVVSGSIPSYNLLTLTFLYPFNFMIVKVINYITAIGILVLQVFRKLPLYVIILLFIGHTLIFYNLVFHYNYSIIPGLIALGILLDYIEVNIKTLLAIILLTLPTPLIIFRMEYFSLSYVQYASIGALWSITWLSILLSVTTLPYILKPKVGLINT